MKMQQVESSLIESVGYDEEASQMHLRIKRNRGGGYYIIDVPQEVYEEMMQHRSIGGFYLSRIKKVYPWTKKEEG